MEVAITVTDAIESATSVAFAKMLEASLTQREIESETFASTQPQAILNFSTKEASGSDFIKRLSENVEDLEHHIDIQTFSTDHSPTESPHFILPTESHIFDPKLSASLVNALSLIGNTITANTGYDNMYPSVYAKLVLRVPTLTVLINEESVDLYRAAADEIAEFVENYAQ